MTTAHALRRIPGPRIADGGRRGARAAAGLAAAALAGWSALAALAWTRYGRVRAPRADPVLDALLPDYEVHERHQLVVAAPPELTFEAMLDIDLARSPLVRGIFALRERLLGARERRTRLPRGLLAETRALGWRVVHETPGRRLVLAAVTRPWKGDVTFRGMRAPAFARFARPGWVKIVWTLEVVPRGDGTSIARTETRVATTDARARRRFRAYWAAFSPGIVLIRLVALRQARASAERRADTRRRWQRSST